MDVAFATSLSLLALLAGPVGCGPAHDTGDAGAAGSDGAPAPMPATLTFSAGPNVPLARHHHMTFIADTASARFLYVAGGFDGTRLLSSVARSPIGDDGSLGPWEMVAPLPVAIAGAGVVVTHGEVVIAGGFSSSAVYTAGIAPDGSLGDWRPEPALPGVRFHTAAVASGDFVYVVGGIAGSSTTSDVARSRVAADGSLAAWEVAAHLPYTLSHHGCIVEGSTLYVVGGETGNASNDTAVNHAEVYTASLADDGTVGAWTPGPALPLSIVTHALIVDAGHLYAIGGLTSESGQELDDVVTDQIWRAPLRDGTLGDWQVDPTHLPRARSHVHQTPVSGGHVYSVAGMVESGDATDLVDVGTFRAP